MHEIPPEVPILIAQTGPLNGQRWPVSQTIVIGRDPGCDIVIADRQISRYHARLTPDADGVLMEDLGSKNGTYCNGAVVMDPVRLQDGDQVQIALAQHFVYLSSDATLPLDGTLPAVLAVQSNQLTLDALSRRVWVGGVEIVPPLSAPQFRLLQILYTHAGQVVSRSDLVESVWTEAEAEGVSEQALDALIRRLRERLADADPHHTYLTTVRGHGVRLDLGLEVV
ncbi:MAG TPA: FHA domain-containing protein [Anaerolineaceae bacterium]|jgi:DNA-binding winged helix-turn-helix (wHTH) protein|nr:FHA domain-containing protein [Anaerolineaceae bacterium]